MTLTDVTVSDPLPGLPTPTCDTSGALRPGATRVCTATYTVTQDDLDSGTLLNTATLSATGPDGQALTTMRDSMSVPVEGVAAADFTKVAETEDSNDNGITDPGDTVRYLLAATNTGPLTLTGVQIADPLPGLVNRTCTLPEPASLAPGQQLACTAEYVLTDADAARGALTNEASLSSDQIARRTAAATVAVTDQYPARPRSADPRSARPRSATPTPTGDR